jgi:hypothetical protein
MKVITGKDGFGDRVAVMGRILFSQGGVYRGARTGEALIPVVYDVRAEILDDPCVVGAVLISEKSGDGCHSLGFPCLSVEQGQEKELAEMNGKLAYLDPRSRLLISAPDIDTVNKYEEIKERGARGA